MTPTFSEHVDLLDHHARAAVLSLGQLGGDDPLPPRDELMSDVARESWATLEIWAWAVAHLDEHWSEREDPAVPATHADVVADLAAEAARLGTSLRTLGPDVAVDYFGRPGTTAEVARLVAHEAITLAHKVGQAESPAVSPAVARDGVDHAITHWSTSATDIAWQPQTSAIRASDTRDEWQISLPQDGERHTGDFRIASPQTPAAVVEGPAVDLLWWLQGYAISEAVVSVSGNDADVRALKQTFLQPVPKTPRRWFGLRSS